MTLLLDIFVPGILRNPLNGSWGGWRKHARLAREWRDRTTNHLLIALRTGTFMPAPSLIEPKRVLFTAYTGAQWDDDAIPGALKPVRDALVGIVIHSDAPDSGHEFVYRQAVRREQRGVGISVTPRAYFQEAK